MASSLGFTVFAFVILSAAAKDSDDEGSGVGPPPSLGKLRCKLDLGLVVDLTKSIRYKNLPIIRDSVKQFVKRFKIGPNDTHLSLETFAGESTLQTKFNDAAYYSEQALVDLMGDKLRGLSSPTRLDKALFMADQKMFNFADGYRVGVRGVNILITDGKTNPASEDFSSAVQSLKAKGVRMMVVAVGPKSKYPKHKEVLKSIAGDDVYYASAYDNFDALFDDMAKVICPEGEICSVDLALIADKTRSVGEDNFEVMKGFLVEITNSLDISPGTTHEAVITYANVSQVLNTLGDSKYHSNKAMHMLIANIDNKLSSPTRTDRALEAAKDYLFTKEGGDRPNFPNSLVLFTDGKTNPASKPYSQIIPLVKQKKVHITVVEIGDKVLGHEDELAEIGGENVHFAKDFGDLSDLYKILLDEICSVDGGFSDWGPYSACSVTCGDGIQQRTRSCNNPPPQGQHGKDCEGLTIEKKACKAGLCPL